MDSTKNEVTQNLIDALSQIKRLHRSQSPVDGLKHSEIGVLFCIKNETASPELGIKVSKISDNLRVTPPTITQLMKGLEAHGYIERTKDPNDRRAVRIKLTDKGESVIKKASDNFYITFKGLVEYLGEEKSKEFTEVLLKVFTYFDEKKKEKLQQQLTGDDNQ